MEQDRIWSWMGAGGGLVADGGWWLLARVQVDVGPFGVRSVLVPLSLGYITRVRAREREGNWVNGRTTICACTTDSSRVCPCPKAASPRVSL